MRPLAWLGITVWVSFLFFALGTTGCARTVEKIVERSQPRVVGVELTLTDVTPTTIKTGNKHNGAQSGPRVPNH